MQKVVPYSGEGTTEYLWFLSSEFQCASKPVSSFHSAAHAYSPQSSSMLTAM